MLFLISRQCVSTNLYKMSEHNLGSEEYAQEVSMQTFCSRLDKINSCLLLTTSRSLLMTLF